VGFSPRGICFSDFFSSLFSRAARGMEMNRALAPAKASFRGLKPGFLGSQLRHD